MRKKGKCLSQGWKVSWIGLSSFQGPRGTPQNGHTPFWPVGSQKPMPNDSNLHSKYIKVLQSLTNIIWFGVSQVTPAALKNEDHDLQPCELFLNQGCLADGLSVSENPRKHLFLIHPDPLCGQVGTVKSHPDPFYLMVKTHKMFLSQSSLRTLRINWELHWESTSSPHNNITWCQDLSNLSLHTLPQLALFFHIFLLPILRRPWAWSYLRAFALAVPSGLLLHCIQLSDHMSSPWGGLPWPPCWNSTSPLFCPLPCLFF